MNKLYFLTKTSLKKKLGTKWFLVVNLIIAVCLIGIINIDSIISYFGGDFDNKLEVVVIDNTKEVYPLFKESINSSKTLLDEEFDISLKESKKTLKEEKKKIKEKVLIEFNGDPDDFLKVAVVSQGKVNTMDYQMLVQALTATKSTYGLIKSNIDPVALAKISTKVEIDRIILDQDARDSGEDMDLIMSTVFPTVILPFFILIIFLVQMIGAEINEEKTTRSMEIIISNVSAKTHFFSKVISSNLFVIIQGLLLMAFGALGLLIRFKTSGGMTSTITDQFGSIIATLGESGILDKLIYIIPATLVLMLLSFLAYSLVAGILASMTTNMEDYQQIQTPIIFTILIAYYLTIMASMFNGSTFIQFLSYVPFISCLLSPALMVIGDASLIDVLISVGALVVFNFVAIKYGLKFYKSGILNYSNEKIWLRVKKIVKSK